MFKNKFKKNNIANQIIIKKKTKKIGKRDEMTNISPTEAVVFCRQITYISKNQTYGTYKK